MTEQPVTLWLNRLNEGDSLAANRLWEAYYEKLMALARKKLLHFRKRAADEEDLVVEAFHSFFRGIEKGRFPKLEDRNDLWQILVMLTARKAVNQIKHELREKRGGGAVRGESMFQKPNDGSGNLGIDKIVGEEPTPEFAEQVIEQCDELLSRLGDDGSLRTVAIRKLEGFTNAEIAEELRLNERTIERKLRIIREALGHETG